MSDENKPIEEPVLPAIKIIQQIKEGIIDPQKLPKDIRQVCVECLLAQFMSIPKIAAFMKMDDRTIQRDKKEIDQRNSQKPSVDYSLQLISELMRKANSIQEHLMSLSKDDEASVQEKAQAGYYLWKALQEQMKLLQSLGYLQEQPMRIEANITHEEEKDTVKLKEELAEAEKMAHDAGRSNDPVIAELIKSIKQQIALAEAGNSIEQLRNILTKKDEGTSNEQGSQ